MQKGSYTEFDGILIDPKSKEQLFFNESDDCLQTKNKQISYESINGIIDLLPEVSDIISQAYDKFSSSYDPWVSGSKLGFRILKRTIWGIKDEFEYTTKVMNFISDDFDGIILDVPIGTGIFTVEKYQRLSKAKIIAVDYSMEMLKIAKKRFDEAGVENVIYFRGDVCHLPLASGSIDLLISMSGLETFAEKDEAIQEMARVIKPNGQFTGCTYVKGKKKIKDIFSKLSSRRKKLVVEPFFTEDEYREKFNAYFEILEQSITKSIWGFNATKKLVKGNEHSKV